MPIRFVVPCFLSPFPYLTRSLLLVTGLVFFVLAGCQQEKPAALRIATAANMQFAMKEIARSFTDEKGIPCDAIVSSSGKLTAQIMEGAPFDVFVSADMKYPEELYQRGFTAAPPRVYAYGKLVLWSMTALLDPSVESIPHHTIKHVAIAHPETAPYGAAAIEVLTHYGVMDQATPKLVYGESIAQTNQFITTGAAEMGFTAMSVVLSPQMKDQGSWIPLPSHSYSPIAQGVVLLNNRKDKQASAKQFYDFLFSEKVKGILQQYGYGTVEDSGENMGLY